MKSSVVIIAVLLMLPSVAAAWDCSVQASDPCELGSEFMHTAVAEEAGVRVTLASTRASYVQGETVEFRLKFENIGTEHFCMNFGHDPDDVVWVLPEGCSDVNALCADNSPWWFPNTVVYAPGSGVGLEPGECRVYSYYSWDTASGPADPGTYDALGGLFELDYSRETVGTFRMPSTPVSLPIEITAGVPATELSVGMLKARY